jgi:predicted deacylase
MKHLPGKHRLSVRVTDDVALPLLIVRGEGDGPILAVSAGVHGDEYEGVRAIFEAFELLNPSEMSGTLLAVPVVNFAAHRACSRTNPADDLNLARVFPGDPHGSITQQIAYTFGNEVIAKADFYLDLHSGGVRYEMPSMAGYEAANPRGRAAAEIFGAPAIWGHPVIEPGRTISFARDRGIPFLYTEARGAGRIHGDDLRMMRQGILNLLRHLGILRGTIERGVEPRRLFGAGNTDDGIAACADGFLITDVKVLDRVTVNERLGRLVDILGRPIEEYFAPRDATVGLVRRMPAVSKGDTLFLLAEEQ